ncbi:hypothetical protein WICMUC_005485 [Wickerhamomyces mucosus]|uniref:Uncharacterized protein n=1 Tax=Wickerhamomyces mucosus TaxID=1378264 RepID=A0A9P8P6E5_9ASCO|nr:hypothetical protein WICMUC_005485 [Wickerhamomyces mucosus]
MSGLLSINLRKSFKLSSTLGFEDVDDPPTFGNVLSTLEERLKLDLLATFPNDDEYFGVPPLELNSFAVGNPCVDPIDDVIDLGMDED